MTLTSIEAPVAPSHFSDGGGEQTEEQASKGPRGKQGAWPGVIYR